MCSRPALTTGYNGRGYGTVCPDPSPSPPPPSPSPPPAPPVAAADGGDGDEAVVLAEFTVAGDISDVPQEKIKSEIAKAANVATTAVTLSLVAASVKIFAAIAVPAGTTAAAISAGVTSTLGSTTAASTAFGVTVTSAATVSVTTPNGASSTIVAAKGAIAAAVGLTTGVLIAVIVGPIVAVLLLCILLCWCCKRRKRHKAGAPTASTAVKATQESTSV